MRSIDLLLIAGVVITGGCSMQHAQKAVVTSATDACHREIVEKIEQMTGVSELKLSKDVMRRSSMLILSNHPRSSMPMEDPMVGVKGSEKIFRLTKKDGACILTLLDDAGRRVKSTKLANCQCHVVGGR